MKSNASGLKLPGYFLFNVRTEYNFSLGENLEHGANGTFFLDWQEIFLMSQL